MSDQPERLYPGTWAERTPDHPAVIMGGSGEVVTYAQAPRAGLPGGAAVPLDRAPARRPRRPVPGEPARVPAAALGRPLRRPLLHGHQLPAHGRRAGLHHRGLREPGLHHLAPQGRPGGPAHGPDRRARPAGVGRRRGRRLRARSRTCWPPQPAEEPPEAVEGQAMLYSSGTTGRPKGVKAPLAGDPLGTPDATHDAGHPGVRRQRLLGLPLPRAAVPRRPAGVLHGLPAHRGHGRGHGALRRGRGPGPHRAPPGDPQPVGADHVQPDAEAARGGPRPRTTSARCRSRSTPPPRARSRSRSR